MKPLDLLKILLTTHNAVFKKVFFYLVRLIFHYYFLCNEIRRAGVASCRWKIVKRLRARQIFATWKNVLASPMDFVQGNIPKLFPPKILPVEVVLRHGPSGSPLCFSSVQLCFCPMVSHTCCIRLFLCSL